MDEVNALCREKNIPSNALFELTAQCNLKCFHCYNPLPAEEELTTTEVCDALKQLADLGCLYLTLSGGELYCRPDVGDIFEKAKALGFAWNLFTNASMMTAQRIAELRDLKVFEVSVSVFSMDPEVHDGITGTPGSLLKTIQGLEAMAGAGLRLRIRCVLMKKNLTGYRNILDLAKRLNATCHFDTNLMPGGGNDFSVFRERLDRKELSGILADPDVFSVHGNPLEQKSAACDGRTVEMENSQVHCAAGASSLYISPRGDIYPCVHFPRSAGNLRRQKLKHIWETSPVFRQVRKISPNSLDECPSCEHVAYCARCPALAEKEDGSLTGPSRWACTTAEAMKTVFQSKKF
jgi:radical SAM protein with 4Fe4S-binding SPASM domain